MKEGHKWEPHICCISLINPNPFRSCFSLPVESRYKNRKISPPLIGIPSILKRISKYSLKLETVSAGMFFKSHNRICPASLLPPPTTGKPYSALFLTKEMQWHNFDNSSMENVKKKKKNRKGGHRCVAEWNCEGRKMDTTRQASTENRNADKIRLKIRKSNDGREEKYLKRLNDTYIVMRWN